MNQAASDSRDLTSLADIAETYELELQAVHCHLGAATSDLLPLLSLISARNPSRQQTQGLLESACARLQTLRIDIAGLASLADGTNIEGEINRASSALQTGDGFSLDDADAACERAYRISLEAPGQSEIAVRIRAAQALTLAELAGRHKVHPNLITKWKRQGAEGMVEVFSGKPGRRDGSHEAEVKELHAKIGELTIEKDFLSKAFGR